MENKQSSTLRLIYPQWQGGIITSLVTDLEPNEASTGYFLGAQMLNFLAPNKADKQAEVPVSLDVNDRAVVNGINSYNAILKQTKSALEILDNENPDRILTLGGECSVSVVPFTYLAKKYPDDVAIVWIDAHPDINLPYDNYKGYHAMALAACMGIGDETINKMLPATIDKQKALLVGLRAWDDSDNIKERQEEWGIKSLSLAGVAKNSNEIIDWIKGTGASKVVIHFDLDVIDPSEMIAAVGTDPDGMKIDEVVRVINDIASNFDLVGLTIAEPMPRTAIKIKNMLNNLPLFN